MLGRLCSDLYGLMEEHLPFLVHRVEVPVRYQEHVERQAEARFVGGFADDEPAASLEVDPEEEVRRTDEAIHEWMILYFMTKEELLHLSLMLVAGRGQFKDQHASRVAIRLRSLAEMAGQSAEEAFADQPYFLAVLKMVPAPVES